MCENCMHYIAVIIVVIIIDDLFNLFMSL